ncbi:hypothetical protein [Parafrankia elaeagni]|uniref:hypothetical protein n=1 Tax=Parafrankia elaeagni TaxID=222534 RepID=UPI00036FA300|nr:hypothetical protein [Parafrankia elaeagni]
MPYLRALLAATSDRLPEGLAGDLDRLIRQLRRAIVTATQPPVRPRRRQPA